MEQFNSGKLQKIFRNISCVAFIGLIVSGKYPWLEEEIREDSSSVLIFQEQLCISEVNRDIQDAILIDHVSQDNVVIQSNFFQYIFLVGCTFNLHSFICSKLIFGGQILSKRQRVFFLLVDPMDNHKDPDVIDLNVPRHAQCLHNARKGLQDAACWVDINLAFEKEIAFFQTRSNVIISQETLPSYCIPKVVRMETGEVFYERVYMSPRLPPKISLKHGREKEVQNMLNVQNLGNYLEVTRQTKQFWKSKSRGNGETRFEVWYENCARWKNNVPFSGDRC